jgi:hypothetical protein
MRRFTRFTSFALGLAALILGGCWGGATADKGTTGAAKESLEKEKKLDDDRRATKAPSGMRVTAQDAPGDSSGEGGGGAGGASAGDTAKPQAAPPPTGVSVGGPALSFSFSPRKAKAGAKVTLTLSAPVGGVEVYFAGDELTATSKQGGKVLVVTLPKDASSGYLELRVNGQAFKAAEQLEVQ